MNEENTKSPTKQGEYKVGNKKPPVERQFGQPNGNPRHNGAWKKEETARWKFEQMIKMTDGELESVQQNPDAGRLERTVAKVLLDTRDRPTDKQLEVWKIIEGIVNQIYGAPKQRTEVDLGGEIKTVEVRIKDYTNESRN